MPMIRADLTLRPAEWADVDLLYAWTNDPATRAVSFSKESIPYETHCSWLRAKLDFSDCLIRIGMVDAKPVGVVRFDRHKQSAVVSISIDKAYRGRGYGYAILQLGCAIVFDCGFSQQIIAWIEPANTFSLKLFTGVGFIKDDILGTAEHPGALKYILAGKQTK